MMIFFMLFFFVFACIIASLAWFFALWALSFVIFALVWILAKIGIEVDIRGARLFAILFVIVCGISVYACNTYGMNYLFHLIIFCMAGFMTLFKMADFWQIGD